MARLSVDPKAGITVTCALLQGIREKLTRIIREGCGDDVIVRLFAFAQPADGAEPVTDTD